MAKNKVNALHGLHAIYQKSMKNLCGILEKRLNTVTCGIYGTDDFMKFIWYAECFTCVYLKPLCYT